jgi:alcohol dehydrogenase (NADP+)
MYNVRGYAALSAQQPLGPFDFLRRKAGSTDVVINIEYCGVCHSDIHQARGEWGGSTYPMVPGHEIVGTVAEVGPRTKKFKVGDRVGVGCFVDSCRVCPSCTEGLEQYCEDHLSLTYNGTEQDKSTPTQGGYSTRIVVDEKYVLKIPSSLEASAVAPLLCAGITTYSPLRHWGVTKGKSIAILGLGGLGHMGVKFASAFGADVTVLSTSPKKEADARRLGAKDFQIFTDEQTRSTLAGKFDFILDTVSAAHDINALASLLKRDGTLIMVGVPSEALPLAAFSIIPKRISIAGSMIGGIRETQEMLDYCGETGIVSDVEVISMKDINEAYERTIRGDVRYRFVIDIATL